MKVKTQINTMRVRTCNSVSPIAMVYPHEVDSVFPPSQASRVNTIAYNDGGPTEINYCIASKAELSELPLSPFYGFNYWRISELPSGGYVYSRRDSLASDRIAYGINPARYAITSLGGPSESEVAAAAYGGSLRVYELGTPRVMNLPLAIAELKDTPGTLKSARDLIKFVISLPMTRAAELASGSLRGVASAYLAYHFGIKPSARDVELYLKQFRGAGATVFRKPIRRLKGETIRAKFRLGPNLDRDYIPRPTVRTNYFTLSPSPSEFGDVGIIANNTTGMWPSLHVYEASEAQGVVFGRFSRDEFVGDDTPLGRVRLAFPYFGTVWALCPFSFLVDWVYDVSTYLEQLERAMVLKHRRVLFDEGLWTSIRRSTTTYVPVLQQDHGFVVHSWSPSTGNLTVQYNVIRSVKEYRRVVDQIDYERSPYSQLLPPVPWLNTQFKSYQLTTAAMLCVQFLPVVRQVRRYCAPRARLTRRMRRLDLQGIR